MKKVEMKMAFVVCHAPFFNVSTASQAFSDRFYIQYLDFEKSDVSDLRIGLRHFTPTVYDWACVDNFSLTYYSSGTNVKSEEARERKDKNMGLIYDLSGQVIQHSPRQKGIYIIKDKKLLIK